MNVESKKDNKKVIIGIVIAIAVIIASWVVIAIAMNSKNGGDGGRTPELPISDVDPDDVEPVKDTQRVGSNTLGYFIVPAGWVSKTVSWAPEPSIVYGSEDDTEVAALSFVDTGGLDLMEYAHSQVRARVDAGDEVQIVDVMVGDAEGYEVSYYSNATSKWVYLFFANSSAGSPIVIHIEADSNESNSVSLISGSWEYMPEEEEPTE